MNHDELLKAACDVIGKGEDDDYIIAPSDHSEALASSAPALSKILCRSQVTRLARNYQFKDSEAIDAQKTFLKAASRANQAVLATVCISAVLMVVGILAQKDQGKLLLAVLGSCAIISGALGSMWLFMVREGKLLEGWLTARAAAEETRLAYFAAVTNAENGGEASDIPLPLLQLEYFRRYQLDVQTAFFRRRGKDHRRAASKVLTLSAFAILLGAMATGLAGFLGLVNPKFAALAALGGIAGGLSAFAAAKEALSQSRSNAERYAKTLDALEALAAKLDDVRDAAASGSREPLQQFVAGIQEQLALEQRQWLGTAENTQASLAKLDDALTNARTKLEKTSQGGANSTGK